MPAEPFMRKIESLRRRLATLSPDAKTADGALHPKDFNPWQELQTAVEELFVAQEELRGQNEELILTRLELEGERRRYHDLFEFAPDPYLVTDLAGVVQEANRAAAALFNTPVAKLAGKPLVLFVAPEDRLAYQTWLTRLGREEGQGDKGTRGQGESFRPLVPLPRSVSWGCGRATSRRSSAP